MSRAARRYTREQLRTVIRILERLDHESGVDLAAICEAHSGGHRPTIYDMLKHLENSGDVIRVGMGQRYRSIRPEASR